MGAGSWAGSCAGSRNESGAVTAAPIVSVVIPFFNAAAFSPRRSTASSPRHTTAGKCCWWTMGRRMTVRTSPRRGPPAIRRGCGIWTITTTRTGVSVPHAISAYDTRRVSSSPFSMPTMYGARTSSNDRSVVSSHTPMPGCSTAGPSTGIAGRTTSTERPVTTRRRTGFRPTPLRGAAPAHRVPVRYRPGPLYLQCPGASLSRRAGRRVRRVVPGALRGPGLLREGLFEYAGVRLGRLPRTISSARRLAVRALRADRRGSDLAAAILALALTVCVGRRDRESRLVAALRAQRWIWGDDRSEHQPRWLQRLVRGAKKTVVRLADVGPRIARRPPATMPPAGRDVGARGKPIR
jgi:hypothetical protein